MFRFLSYWLLPVFSGLVWLTMLMTMLIYWTGPAQRILYPTMDPTEDLAFISDVGAEEMKPLFIAACSLTSLLLTATLCADRWLRYKGRLVPYATRGESVLSWLAISFVGVGTLALIALTIWDMARHKNEHQILLLFFMGGYICAAIFVCWEYQRLWVRNPQYRILKVSFWIKVVFVGLAIALSVAFTATTYLRNFHVGAPLEWVVGFLLGLFIVSFAVDLYPAVHTKNGAYFAPKDFGRAGESTDSSRSDAEMAERGKSDFEGSRRRASELSRDSDEMLEVRYIESVESKV